MRVTAALFVLLALAAGAGPAAAQGAETFRGECSGSQGVAHFEMPGERLRCAVTVRQSSDTSTAYVVKLHLTERVANSRGTAVLWLSRCGQPGTQRQTMPFQGSVAGRVVDTVRIASPGDWCFEVFVGACFTGGEPALCRPLYTTGRVEVQRM